MRRWAFRYNYFTNGIDLSLTENLINIVKQVGLDKNKALEILKSDAFLEELNIDNQRAQKLGIRGVPFFFINNNLTISGAQNDRVFIKTLESALKAANAND